MLNVFNPVEKVVPTDAPSNDGWSPVELAFVCKPGVGVYIEWPEDEPMVNVLAIMIQAERGAKGIYSVAFDPEDEDMLEVLVGGYRLHGMFINDLI